MKMYRQCKPYKDNPVESVLRLDDGACIPFAPDNTDYQTYLKWLAEGNEPLPPDNNQ